MSRAQPCVRHVRNAAASSAQSLAAFHKASSTHVQNIRAAVAIEVMRVEIDFRASLPPATHAISELAFDESEQLPVLACEEAAIRDMLFLHCKLWWAAAGGSGQLVKHEIVCAPAFLAAKTAEHLVSAIFQRLPFSLDRLRSKTDWLHVTLSSDSGKNCKRLGKHFCADASLERVEHPDGKLRRMRGITTLQSCSLMHQLEMIYALLLTSLGILCAMFCTCCVVQRGHAKNIVKSRSRKMLAQVKPVYVKPSDFDQNRAYLRAVLSFADYVDEIGIILQGGNEAELTSKKFKRLQDRDRLATLLAASEINRDGVIVSYRHWCPFGCHSSWADAVDDILHVADSVHISQNVEVPSVHWMIGITFGWSLHGFRSAESVLCPTQESRCGPLREDKLVGIEDERVFQRKRVQRFQKALAWLSAAPTRTQLAVGVTLMLPMVFIMAKFFALASFSAAAATGITMLIMEKQNPALHVALMLLNKLQDESDVFWIVVAGAGNWTTEKRWTAAVMMMKVVSALWFRMVRPFTLWPRRLARAFHEDTSDEEKRAIAREFIKCKHDCCLRPGFAAELRQAVSTENDLLENLDIIRSYTAIFAHTGVHNISSENRFTRMVKFRRSTARQAATAASIAARHILSESSAWHSQAMREFYERHNHLLNPQCAAALPKVYHSVWDAFCSKHKLQGNMETHVKFMAAMSDPERREELESMVAAHQRRPDASSHIDGMQAPSESAWQGATAWQAGCQRFPLTVAAAKRVALRVSNALGKLQRLVGSAIAAATEVLSKPLTQCCDLYGIGICESDLTADEQDKVKRCKRLLWAVGKPSQDTEVRYYMNSYLVQVL